MPERVVHDLAAWSRVADPSALGDVRPISEEEMTRYAEIVVLSVLNAAGASKGERGKPCACPCPRRA
jgi:hypothetical protein